MKNFTLEFSNHEWVMYTEGDNLYGSEIDRYFKLPNIAYLEDEYTSIVASYDNDEQFGCIDTEITAPKSGNTYSFKIKSNNFSEFLKDLRDLEYEIENEKENVSDWEYELEDPYGSRGLSIRDFI